MATPWAIGRMYPGPLGTPIQPGTKIPLSELIQYSPDVTSFDVQMQTADGGELIDPDGNIYTDNDIHYDIPIGQLSQWSFKSSSVPGSAESLGFDVYDNFASGVYSNASSVVLSGSNIIQGIDTPIILTGIGQSIANAGYKFVVRYYWDVPNASVINPRTGQQEAGVLTTSERADLEKYGLQIATVWENGGNPLPGEPGALSGQGTKDATDAITEAHDAGQQNGSTIYFAVEPGTHTNAAVVEYFSQIDAVFKNNPYNFQVGVYGDGNVFSILPANAVSNTWLTGASYDTPGTNSDNNWSMDQVAVTPDGSALSNLDPNQKISVTDPITGKPVLIGVDIDVAKQGDFGAFGTVGSPDLEIRAVAV
jgi:Domain of unknown function (DUF1906)